MRAILLFLLAAITLAGQIHTLSPAADFDLRAGLKHRHPRHARSFLAATPNGLTLPTVRYGLL